VRKCPYCDFNSHQQPKVLPETEYIDALMRDLEFDLPRVWGRPVLSIFFGGGTPSLFSGEGIGRILDGVRARLTLRPDAEITLETNPGASEADSFEKYLRAGVNRFSFGVQSFDAEKLKRLGRIHTPNDVHRAYQAARSAGAGNINLDLMYALPAQTRTQALDDLSQALALAPEHISHYHLTMEPDTVFAKFPPPDLPSEDDAWEMQEACQAHLRDAGFEHYEVSAYGKPGYRSQHNQIYWRFGDYLGIGAGAHGKITDLNTGRITRIAKQKIPRLYQDTAGSTAAIVELRELTREALPFEFMLNALRLSDGFPEQEYSARTGLQLDTNPAWTEAQARGFLLRDQGWIRTTELGARFLNDVINLF
jgi:putative oxygen-independent coproporphyrinogen III oxidase